MSSPQALEGCTEVSPGPPLLQACSDQWPWVGMGQWSAQMILEVVPNLNDPATLPFSHLGPKTRSTHRLREALPPAAPQTQRRDLAGPRPAEAEVPSCGSGSCVMRKRKLRGEEAEETCRTEGRGSCRGDGGALPSDQQVCVALGWDRPGRGEQLRLPRARGAGGGGVRPDRSGLPEGCGESCFEWQRIALSKQSSLLGRSCATRSEFCRRNKQILQLWGGRVSVQSPNVPLATSVQHQAFMFQ